MAPEAPRTRRPRRWLHLIAGIAVVGLVAIWWTGALAIWPRHQAQQAIHEGRLDEAETLIRRALWIDGGSAESYFLLARIQRKLGSLPEFVDSLDEAVEQGLSRERAERERLLAQAQSGQIAETQAELDYWLLHAEDAEGPELLEAYVNGCLVSARLNEAGVLIDGWEEAFPADPQPNYYRARMLMYTREHEQAAEQLRRALEKRPEHHAAAYLLGQVLIQQNKIDEALVYFQQSTEMHYNAAPLIAEAKTLRTLGRVDEARTVLQGVIELPEEELRLSYRRVGDRYEGAPAHFELGNLESALGNHEAALPFLEEALRANPRDLTARYAYGISLRGVGRVDEAAVELATVSDARQELVEVDGLADRVAADPTLVEERVRIGELYLTYESQLTGEYWLKTALVRDPDNPRAHALLATLYEERAREDDDYAGLAAYHRQMAGDSMAIPDVEAGEGSDEASTDANAS